MAIAAMMWAWQVDTGISLPTRAVLLALADHAELLEDDDGGNPKYQTTVKVKTLADQTHLRCRQLQGHLRSLKQAQLIQASERQRPATDETDE